jgi:hypothetical protein
MVARGALFSHDSNEYLPQLVHMGTGEQGLSVEWDVQATEFADGNCDYGCACQFNAAPTHGDCREQPCPIAGTAPSTRAMVRRGSSSMSTLIPGSAMHQSRSWQGMMAPPGVFAAMSPKKLPPQSKPVRFDVDVESRHTRWSVASITGEPIRNPISGAGHWVQIGLPHGFEFRMAELASGTTRRTAEITLDLKGTHSHFARIHFSDKGVVA